MTRGIADVPRGPPSFALPAARVWNLRRGPLTVKRAEQLCGLSYYDPAGLIGRIVDQVVIQPKAGDPLVSAKIIAEPYGDVLVADGTRDLRQWRRWNLALWPAAETGATRRWSAGFYGYSLRVYDWLRERPIVAATGHSLGAPGAIIGAASRGIPVIGFASPPSLYGDAQPDWSGLILNVNRSDDLITRLGKILGLGDVGAVARFTPARRTWLRQDHRTPQLLMALDGSEPGTWELDPPDLPPAADAP